MSAFAQRALIGVVPLDPRLRGTPSRKTFIPSRRPENKTCGLSYLGPLGPAQAKISSILR